MEENIKFPTTFGLYTPAIVLSGIFLGVFWLICSNVYLRDQPINWLPYVLSMVVIPIFCYIFGWLLSQASRQSFNESREWSLQREEEDQKKRNELSDLVVRKFHPNSIGFDKEAYFPTVTFEVGGKARTICKMGDTYYEVVDLD